MQIERCVGLCGRATREFSGVSVTSRRRGVLPSSNPESYLSGLTCGAGRLSLADWSCDLQDTNNKYSLSLNPLLKVRGEMIKFPFLQRWKLSLTEVKPKVIHPSLIHNFPDLAVS